ncbi:sodium-dependent transporter [Larsenimonas suaedae]|uniref:Transporter n=1 Tax=Larsenimonas suaedae TaxID=1851019 RepID=A0ABU1GXA2_9GAMM|nr:sodium-dependent transporter [Larsenimonas suaedae]MCM2971418.1 sodium-dependent transporter [Larsenimonas suaedae]MDR5896674.1 sodium-dependent transporter [Larsenimonas suaedae]
MSESATTTQWVGRWGFVLAATGSAVGLGNIWKFPYMTGEYGGAAFVLVYLVCILLIGLPLMMAEITLGRRGRGSPVDAVKAVARESNRSSLWSIVGWMSMISGFLILCFYVVVAGWALSYVWKAISGGFGLGSVEAYEALFGATNANPWSLGGWSTLVIVITLAIVGKGVQEGIEKNVNWMMPGLVILLGIMIGYGVFSGGFGDGVRFMFAFDPEKLTAGAMLAALGHAFFTLSLAAGAIMTYGSYLPAKRSIARTSMLVAACDTVIAMMAGLAIFPVIFANNMDPSSGPGLIFMSLPLAFDQMPFGGVIALIFFVMLSLAALTSSISMIEATVAFLERHTGARRSVLCAWVGVVLWIISFFAMLSFNLGAGWTLAGKTVFDWLDFLTSRWLMPLGGLLTALMAGYVFKRSVIKEEVNLSGLGWVLWQFALRAIVPVGITLVFLDALGWLDFNLAEQWYYVVAAVLGIAALGELMTRVRRT